MSDQCLYISFAAFAILVLFIYPRKRKFIPQPVEEFTYEMTNVDREALRISREIKKADTEEKLWAALGMINRFESFFLEDNNAYDYGRALRDEYDQQIEKLYGSVQQTA